MKERFHAFWVNPYGMRHHEAHTDSLDEILALVKKDHTEHSEVSGLVVVRGEKLEFEPCTVVETYRIKESAA